MEFEETFRWFILDSVAAAAIGTIIYGARQMMRRNAEREWPRVEGFIHESRIQRVKCWAASIRYSYTFRGRKYQGTRISPLYEESKHRSEQQAERDRRRYPYGKTVSVYVNPEDPSDAVLDPRSGSGRALVHLLSGIAGLLMVAIHILVWR